ncbi:LEPR-XLL domain-containing protein [Limimaricola soesokkakensis]
MPRLLLSGDILKEPRHGRDTA